MYAAESGKWSEVESTLAVARTRFPGNTRFLDLELQGQLSRGNLEAYRKGVDSAMRVTDPRNPSGSLYRAAGLAVMEGRLRDWRSFVLQAWRIDSTVGVKTPAIAITGSALGARIQFQLRFDNELKAYEEQLKRTPLSSLPATDVPYLQIVRLFAQAGRVQLARAAMAEHERAVTDTTLRRDQQPALHAALGEIASAEGRWQDAVREIRKSDSLPDGPVSSCAQCLPLTLLRIFAQAGMADSALAQYEAYLKTPWGARPRMGPDIEVPATTMEAVARMYEQRGDTARAVQAYRDFVEIWKRADPELQPRVVAARKQIEALAPVERSRR